MFSTDCREYRRVRKEGWGGEGEIHEEEERRKSNVFQVWPDGLLKTFTFRGTFAQKRWNGNLTKDRAAEGLRVRTHHRRSCLYNRFRSVLLLYNAPRESGSPFLVGKYRKIFGRSFPRTKKRKNERNFAVIRI